MQLLSNDLLALVLGVLGVSIAANGFFVKEAIRELRELRACDRTREVEVSKLQQRVGFIEYETGIGLPGLAAPMRRGLS